ncbi:MAG TPA: hypothetical protein PK246_06340, partial [Saprospiraceae bacterium]|nr:hypothetical protein [Saprospiraceae bacterium]
SCYANDSTHFNQAIDSLKKYNHLKIQYLNYWPKECDKYLSYVWLLHNDSLKLNNNKVDSIVFELNEILDLDKHNRDNLDEQKLYDSIALKKYRTILPEYIKYYKYIKFDTLNSDKYFIQPAIIFGHNKYEQSSFIIPQVNQGCKNKLLPWEELEQIQIQKYIKFPDTIYESKRIHYFRNLTFKDNKIDIDLSMLDLYPLYTQLRDNANLNLYLWSRSENDQNIDLILGYMRQNGITNDRLNQVSLDSKILHDKNYGFYLF